MAVAAGHLGGRRWWWWGRPGAAIEGAAVAASGQVGHGKAAVAAVGPVRGCSKGVELKELLLWQGTRARRVCGARRLVLLGKLGGRRRSCDTEAGELCSGFRDQGAAAIGALRPDRAASRAVPWGHAPHSSLAAQRRATAQVPRVG